MSGSAPVSLIGMGGWVLSDETRHRPGLPPKFELKITDLPSADQRGAPTTSAATEVTRISSPPSSEIVLTSSGKPEPRLRTNITRLPSAENDGARSSAVGGGFVSGRTSDVCRLTRWIASPPLKAMNFPSGDQFSSLRLGTTLPVSILC